MSDINLDFTVSNNSIDFTVQPNDITITPTDIQLTFSTNSLPLAGGSNTQLQYNNSDLLAGIPFATYNGSNLSLGNVANIKITGGTNGYVLQTDGTGNLDWTAMSGGGGNGAPGGSNTQIQYNDAGSFGGNTGFTFNEVTGNVAIPGNIAIIGNVSANLYTGTLSTASQPNITSLGTLTNLSVAGNITAQSYEGALGSLPYGLENISLIIAQVGTYNMDLISNAIKYTTTDATANIVLNFRGNSSVTANTLIANGQSITSTYVMINGASPYTITGIEIDGVAQTIKYAGGLSPAGYANTTLAFTFTIIKTSTTPTYDVLGSATRYS